MATDVSNAAYVWSFRQVCTQDNVAGGTLICRVTAPTGGCMKLLSAYFAASGTRAINAYVYDVDGNASAVLASQGASAGANMSLPNIGSTAATSGNACANTGLIVGGTDQLRFSVVSAAQTETAAINIQMLVSIGTAPTVVWTDSAGTPNVAAATNNTLTAVVNLR